jgi:hypothetical protein
MDLNFIQFYIYSKYEKSLEDYFFVGKSTVSNWRKRGLPKKYINIFIDKEKSKDIYQLFERLYPKEDVNFYI